MRERAPRTGELDDLESFIIEISQTIPRRFP